MRGYFAIGGAVVAVTFLSFSHWQAYCAGRAVEQSAFSQKISQENTHAGNAAENWRADLRRCNDAGGFDFATGACER